MTQSCKYCSFWTKGPLQFKTRLIGLKELIFILYQELSPISDAGCEKHPTYRHNEDVMSHEIAGSNGQAPPTRSNIMDPHTRVKIDF